MSNSSDVSSLLYNISEINKIKDVFLYEYNRSYGELSNKFLSLKSKTNFNDNILYALADQKNDINTKTNQFIKSFRNFESICNELINKKNNSLNINFILDNITKMYTLNNELKEHLSRFSEINNNLSQNFIGDKGQIVEISVSGGFLTEIADKIITINKKILACLSDLMHDINSSTESVLEKIKIINSEEINYHKIFEDESKLVIKKFNIEVDNISKNFKNKISSFELDQESLNNRNIALNKEIEKTLKTLTDLNEKTQDLELRFSKFINSENTKISEELKKIKDKANDQINPIITEIEEKKVGIETTFSDFKNLVENAGIYDLTKNYKDKADEEKKDYKINNWITIGSISAAILTTIIIITIPIIEYWGEIPAVDINYFTILARLTISIMFFVLAIYTSKQAAKHYQCYQENNRTYLQLAALEPFISRMSDEEKLEIRKVLIPVYFNQNSDEKFSTKGEEVYFPLLVDKIVDAVNSRINPPSN